jgi:hypothetical protein
MSYSQKSVVVNNVTIQACQLISKSPASGHNVYAVWLNTSNTASGNLEIVLARSTNTDISF